MMDERCVGVWIIMGWDDAKVALIAFCSGPWLLITKGTDVWAEVSVCGCQPFDIFLGRGGWW